MCVCVYIYIYIYIYIYMHEYMYLHKLTETLACLYFPRVISEAYLESSQTSVMVHFCENC